MKPAFVLVAALLALAMSHGASLGQTATSTPEDTISKSINAYIQADWRRLASLYHPEHLEAVRQKIVSVVAATSYTEQDLFEEYGVRTLESLKALPAADVFVMALVNRLKRHPPDQRLQDVAKLTRVEFLESREDANDILRLRVRTYLTYRDRVYEKFETYHMKMLDGVWLIAGSETYDTKYRDRSGIELFSD